MGLFTGLLTLPLAPVRGVVWIGDKVAEEVDRQLHDENNIRRELLQLELDYEDGLIDEDQRGVREEELLQLLSLNELGSDWEPNHG